MPTMAHICVTENSPAFLSAKSVSRFLSVNVFGLPPLRPFLWAASSPDVATLIRTHRV